MVDLLGLGLIRDPGGDRLSPRRQPADGRDVQIAKDRQRKGAGDGRGGHHQRVRNSGGIVALASQPRPLVNAEAVLLVDDRQGQTLELHDFGEQGMGSDEDVNLPGLKPCEDLAALG